MLIFGALFWTTGKGGSAPPPPPVVTPPVQPSGGYLYEGRRRSREELKRQRQALGILAPEVQALIADVAARQTETLELDRQKQFEELHRELELRNIAWDAKYLEALAAEREALISIEISKRLKDRLLRQDEEELWLLMQLAAQTVW